MRKKILQLTANGISAISINREGERETEAENRREERKGKRSRAKGEREHWDSRQAYTRDFLAPLLSLSSRIRGLSSRYSRTSTALVRETSKKILYTCTRFISRGFPV